MAWLHRSISYVNRFETIMSGCRAISSACASMKHCWFLSVPFLTGQKRDAKTRGAVPAAAGPSLRLGPRIKTRSCVAQTLIRIRSLRCVMVPRRLTGQGPGLNSRMLLCRRPVRTDSVTRTVKNGYTDMLKRIRYDPGRTTSVTLYSTLDTVLGAQAQCRCTGRRLSASWGGGSVPKNTLLRFRG